VHRKWLREKGWLLNGRADAATCPRCQHGNTKGKVQDLITQSAPSDASSLAMNLPEPIPSSEQPPPAVEKEMPVEWWKRPTNSKQTKFSANRLVVVVPQEPEPETYTAETPVLAPAEPPAPPVLTVVPPSASPDNDQRLKIRFALDTHFDDKIGEYLGMESDQSIADSLGVHVSWVETIREVGYGPLRRTAQAKHHAAEISAIRETIADLRSQLDAAMERLTRLETT
jgi:hypothetical protein